jgi:lipopolysaccharide/colanic/teichoic acid biosynthesis glycosyltransferase/glycosyltransferase involved in cell wall biosynthesis
MKIIITGLRGLPTRYGGIERHVEELAVRLVARGHQVTVYGMKRYTPASSYKGVQLVSLPCIPQKHLEMVSYSLLASLHILLFGKADLVHIQSDDSVLFYLPARLRYPIVATSHGPDYWRVEKWGPVARQLMKILELGYAHLPNQRIVIADFLKKYFQEKYKREFTYIPNGITFHQAPGIDALQRFGLQDRQYILFVGRLMESKGAHTLIEAYQSLPVPVRQNLKLVIVGDFSQPDPYINSLLKHRSDEILFTGFLSGDDLWQIYSHCYLFIFPSTIDFLPFVLLEALSFGIPIIYADVEANRAIVKEHGLPFKPGSPADLAHQIACVVDQPDNLEAISAHTKAYVGKNYDWEQIIDQTEVVYKKALSSINSRQDSSDMRTFSQEIFGVSVNEKTPTEPHKGKLVGRKKFIKRIFDIVAASITLIVLSPLLLLIALLIKFGSPGPILYKQQRIGEGVRPFTMLKFRTMYPEADESLHREHMQRVIANNLSPQDLGHDSTIKMEDDPRVTPVGRILRRTSLDETPQILNVLRGEMSLVGPRPAIPYEVEVYQEWHLRRFEAPGGITGLWQVKARAQVSHEEMIRLDLEYIDKYSLWMDILLLLQTPWVVIRGKGAK